MGNVAKSPSWASGNCAQRLKVIGGQVVHQPVSAEHREHTIAGLILVAKSPQGQLAGIDPCLLGKKEFVHEILDCEPLALAPG